MYSKEKEINDQIAALKLELTGNFFADLETHDQIYTLKKQLNPRIEEHPEEDNSGCLACGS